MKTTYNVESLTRHPIAPATYETSFCGGDIFQTLETWQAAQVAAQGALDRNAEGMTVYVTERGQDGAARPLIRWQCFRVWQGKKTFGEVVEPMRYAIGTVDGGGNFQADTLGNEPEATHYATATDALESIKTLIEHGIDPDNPITDAAILDTTTGRIVWQQEGK